MTKTTAITAPKPPTVQEGSTLEPTSAPRFVVCRKWEESERGWGVRPDGYSLHLSSVHLADFIREHRDARHADHVPNIYDFPSDASGATYACIINDDELFIEIAKSKNGIRRFDNYYPVPIHSVTK